MAVIKIVPMPGVGVPGPQGQAGQDGEGFNFRGEWVRDTAYLKNDVVTQGGSSYIANYDYQDTSGPSLDGDLWAVLAQKGENGSGDNADIADFIFDTVSEDNTESRMTIANHDMVIRTTRTNNQDADISIDSADDVWITANDEVEISSTTDSVSIFTDDFGTRWSFNPGGSLSLPSGSSTDISHASIGAGTSGNIVLETRTATFTSDYQNSTNIFSGSGLYLTINEDSLWIAANANGNITVTFADNTTAQVEQVYDGTSQSIPAMVFGLADSVNKSFEDTFPLTIVAEKVEPKNYVSINSNEATWKFEGDGDLVTPPDAKIVNSAVPGDITLSAYNGVKLSFADVEGAGLKFPDDTVQTTAYTGTDSANHGDFYFDQTTLRVDSSSDMILEANEGDGSVAAQIKVGKGYVPIDIVAYERRDVTFGTGEWSTAEWQSDGGNGGQIVLTGITNINDFLNNSFNGDLQKIIINSDTMYPYSGASYGNGNATIYVTTGPDGGIPVAVTSLGFSWAEKSGMEINYDDSEMNINASNMDLNIYAEDDLSLSGGSDIRFYSSSNSQNNYDWTMSSSGNFELPGSGHISNPVNSSGDGNGYSTIKIVPDTNREQYDQYLVVDPTQPNHIHIRAGGTQDASNAELILGAEENHVAVNDSADSVTIKTKREDSVWTYQNVNSGGNTFIVNLENSEPDYGDFLIDNDIKYTINYVFRNLETYSTEYTAAAPDGTLLEFAPWTFYTFFRDNGSSYWQFNNQGYLSGPAMGYVNVYGIQNPSTSDNLLVYSNDKVLIAGTNGEFLNDSSVASNQIATIGDLPTGATGSFVSQDGKTITVTNGIITGIV